MSTACFCVPEAVNTTLEGHAVTVTRFEPTEVMSTYLLAIIVSDYTNISTKQGDTLVKPLQRSSSPAATSVVSPGRNANTSQEHLHPFPLDPDLGAQDGH